MFEIIEVKVLRSITHKSRDFPQFPLINVYKILHASRGHVYVWAPQKTMFKFKVNVS